MCTKEASVLFSGQIDALSDGFICGFDIGAGAKREKQLKPCATRGGGRTAVECRAQSNSCQIYECHSKLWLRAAEIE